MDLLDLQNLIEADAKYRFELRFDPSKGEEAWWVRAKLWDEKKYTLVPCRLIHGVRTVVYKTTLEEWNNHISRSGIPLLGNDFIQLDRTIKTPEYINTLTPQTHIFIFIDAQTALLAGLRFFFLLEISAHVGRHTPLLTRGNHLGLIPPSLFSRVSLVEAHKSLLWSREGASPLPSTSPSPSPATSTSASSSPSSTQTGPEGNSSSTLAAELARFGHRPWPKEDLDITPLTGRRETYLPYLGREVHAFVDLPGEVFLRGGGRRRGAGVGGGGGGGVSGVVSAGAASVDAGGVGLGGGVEGGGTGVEGEGGAERAMGDAEAGEGTGRPARSAGWSGFLPVDERTVEEAREVLLSASSEAGEAVKDTSPSPASSSPPSPSPTPAPELNPTPQTLYTPSGLLKPFTPPPGSSILEVPEPVPSEGSEFEFEYELVGGVLEGKGGKGKGDRDGGKGEKGKGKVEVKAAVKAKAKAEAKVESKESLSASTGQSPSPSSKKKKKKKSKAKGSISSPLTPNPILSASPAPSPSTTSSSPSSSATASSDQTAPPTATSTAPSPPSADSTPPVTTAPPSADPNQTSNSTPSSTPPPTAPTTSPPSTKKETSKERNIRKREERRQRARERSLMARGAVAGLEKLLSEDARERGR